MQFESGETSATDQKSLAGGKTHQPSLLPAFILCVAQLCSPCVAAATLTRALHRSAKTGSARNHSSAAPERGGGWGGHMRRPPPPQSQPGCTFPPKNTAQSYRSREDSAAREHTSEN